MTNAVREEIPHWHIISYVFSKIARLWSVLPDDMEYGREDELIVNRDGHVARLMECWRHRPHGVT